MTSLYLVEDHLILCEALCAMLAAKGHQVLGCSPDPTRAMSDLLRLRPEVLLLDLNLGAHSGFELLAEVKRRALPVRCIVLSMSAQPRDVAEALRLGASGYVLKGSPASELMNAIEAVMQRKRHLSSEIAGIALDIFMHPERVDDPFGSLSPRERQIVRLVVHGQSSSVIGQQLYLSPKTVATYRSRLMAKLGVADVTALVRLAIQHRLVDSDKVSDARSDADQSTAQLSLFVHPARRDLPTDAA